jgi:hypothetical protein
MSKRSDLLVACMLGNRWNATSAPSAGTTCVANSPTPQGARSRVHLESLWTTIKNDSVSTGLFFTTQIQVRGASNTVLWSVDQLVQSSTMAQTNQSNLAFANPKLGKSLNVFMNTVIGSVTCSINMAGWIEDTDG